MFSFHGEGAASDTIANIVTSTFIPSTQSPAAIGLLSRRSTGSSLSLSRAGLVWTTTVAVSLLLLQWIGNNREKKTTTPLDWLTRFLSQLWSEPSSTKTTARSGVQGPASKEKKEEFKDRTVVLNRGSCHCGSITFKLIPARQVHVVQSPQSGKLQYPTARVPSDQLQLITGKHLWNTYHVRSEDGDIWAYSFCKQCAIHLLHATDADQSSLFVNLQCFNVETDLDNDSKGAAAKVPISVQQQQMQEDDSVAGKNSVISTVTAATQKSFMTTVTALPEYANPRVFANQQRSSSIFSNDSGSDSAAPMDPPPRPRRQNRLPPVKGSPKSNSSSSKGQPSLPELSLPRGVIAYTPTSGAVRYSATKNTRPESSFAQPVAPTAEWPIRQEVDTPKFDEEDDENSISSHSAVSRDGLDYPSTSTMEGHTAASTAANSTTSSSIDYNVTLNRERMLQNMRKHLKASPTKRSEAPPSSATRFD